MATSLSAAFTAIANAIRAKKGVSTTYTPDEMPDAIASIQTNPNLQNKTTTVTPGANWSGTNTNNSTITADSGYDGLSQVNVNVPMLRDGTLMTADTVDTPGTVYSGNTSQSNSQKLLRMKPTKDGMSYTGSYLYMQPNSYLGNASASDVLSGKTFSSSNGIQITGTGSGGTTPTGTKYDTYTSNGTYTSDVSSYANHSVTVNVSPSSRTLKTWTDTSFVWEDATYTSNESYDFHKITFVRSSSNNSQIVIIVPTQTTDAYSTTTDNVYYPAWLDVSGNPYYDYMREVYVYYNGSKYTCYINNCKKVSRNGGTIVSWEPTYLLPRKWEGLKLNI